MSDRCPNPKCGYKIGEGIAANCLDCLEHNKGQGRKRAPKPKVQFNATEMDNENDSVFEPEKKKGRRSGSTPNRSCKKVTETMIAQVKNQVPDLSAAAVVLDDPKLRTVLIEDIPRTRIHRVNEHNLNILFGHILFTLTIK